MFNTIPVEPQTSERRMSRDLTVVEQAIIDGVVGGMTNRQIAERLYLSPLTIRNRISLLLVRFAARNRTELAVKYLEGHH
jgi:DNA-binding NarL/FixJ family response regulator